MNAYSFLLSVRDRVFRSQSDKIWIMTILTAGAYIYYINLGSAPLETWDEGVYAAAARAAVEQGHWLLPHLNWGTAFQPFLEKPPLAIWLEAISMSIFGVGEFAARFPSATATILTSVLIYVFGRDLFNRASGLSAAVVFLTIPYLYSGMNGGRDGGTDMVFAFFGTLMVYCLWQYTQTKEIQSQLLYIGAGAAVLGILTKGFAFGAFVLVAAPVVITYRRRFLTRNTAIAIFGAVFCLSLWPVYAYIIAGSEFIHEILIEQVIERASGGPDPAALLPGMSYPYITRSVDALDPWTFVLPVSIAVGGIRAIRLRMGSERRGIVLLMWWGASVLFLFSFTGNKFWYVIPAFVPAALLVGYLGGMATRGVRSAQVGTFGALLTIILASSRSIHLNVLPEIISNDSGVAPGSSQGIGFVIVMVAVAVVVISAPWIRCRYRSLSSQHMSVAVAVIIIVLVSALVTPSIMLTNDWGRTQYDHSAALDEHAPSDATIYVQSSLRNGRPLFPLDFYTGRRPLSTASTETIAADPNIQYALVWADTVSKIDRPHEVVLTTRYQNGPNAANVSAVVLH